jgi:voltage-gated potassium channel
MNDRNRVWVRPALYTGAFVFLNILAFEAFAIHTLVILGVIIVGAAIVYGIVPRSLHLSIAFTNGLVIYSWLYKFLVELNFQRATEATVAIAYSLPVLAFIGAIILRRSQIVAAVEAEAAAGEARDILRRSHWLAIIGVIGLLTFFVPDLELIGGGRDLSLLAAQVAVACVVYVYGVEGCMFLVQAAVLIASFFDRLRGLFVAVFAFLTFYSLLVITFACIYRILDWTTAQPQFLIAGEARPIAVMESFYFSLITMSTVGYGDIVPVAPAVRILVVVQVICGVLLLLFGFSEIIRDVHSKDSKKHD